MFVKPQIIKDCRLSGKNEFSGCLGN